MCSGLVQGLRSGRSRGRIGWLVEGLRLFERDGRSCIARFWGVGFGLAGGRDIGRLRRCSVWGFALRGGRRNSAVDGGEALV